MGDAHVVAGANDLVPGLESAVTRRHDGPCGVDAARERELAYDLSGAGRGQRVLVIDARIRCPEQDLPGGQLVERHIDHPTCGFVAFAENTESLELVHAPPKGL